MRYGNREYMGCNHKACAVGAHPVTKRKRKIASMAGPGVNGWCLDRGYLEGYAWDSVEHMLHDSGTSFYNLPQYARDVMHYGMDVTLDKAHRANPGWCGPGSVQYYRGYSLEDAYLRAGTEVGIEVLRDFPW